MKVLVTGGGGFIGRNLVESMLAQSQEVVVLARGAYPGLEARGVKLVRGDLTSAAACAMACAGCEVVFHVAALADVGVRLEPFQRTNIDGTRSVLTAARAAGVRRFVLTSSPSVVFSRQGHEGVDERAPLVQETISPYAYTKARAEEIVLAADGDDFRTIALRPHIVWGPGDTQLTARVVERARAGRLKLVGDGRARVDTTYIANCVDAHVLAERALAAGRGRGKAYFISNDEPLEVREFIAGVLEAHGLSPRVGRVPLWLACPLGAGLEVMHRVLRSDAAPLMTRFLAYSLATPHWFDLTAAKRDLGYRPRVSVAEGLEQLRQTAQAR